MNALHTRASGIGLATLGWLVGGCAHRVHSAAPAAACVVDVLYFGRNVPGGGKPDSAIVSQRDWRVFADSAFPHWVPEGSTEIDGVGRYVDGGRLVAESTKVVTVMHPTDPHLDAALDSLAMTYVRRFNQESVGRERRASAGISCRE